MPGMETPYHQAMGLALAAAREAVAHGDVPVGAVLLDSAGTVVAIDHNRRHQHNDPTSHAEILVLREGAAKAGSWRLDGHTLVVSLEPCAMCAGASVAARLGRIVYGPADPKAGAALSLYNIPQDPRLNHWIEVVTGVREAESRRLLEEFFAARR